jgi:20S proteasome alpha/beta subunit
MEKEKLSLEDINKILTEVLTMVIERKISLRHAHTISKITQTLVKNITASELKDRVEFLEQLLKVKR